MYAKKKITASICLVYLANTDLSFIIEALSEFVTQALHSKFS